MQQTKLMFNLMKKQNFIHLFSKICTLSLSSLDFFSGIFSTQFNGI